MPLKVAGDSDLPDSVWYTFLQNKNIPEKYQVGSLIFSIESKSAFYIS
jgi:hypothetical protein